MNSSKNNPKNDRAKRDYLIHLRHARQRSEATIDQVRQAIDRLESYTGFKDFGTFNKEQALGFKKALLATKAQRTGKLITPSTALHILNAIREFLVFLHTQPGFRRRINPADIDYLQLSTKDERAVHAPRPKSYATLEQYRAALFAMPNGTEIECRDRALFALVLLSGMRDAAVIGLQLKHLSVERQHIFQDPRGIDTKFSKSIETWFFPVGNDVVEIVMNWVNYLRKDRLFGDDDPIFPKTAVVADVNGGFRAKGFLREPWSNAAPVRSIFRSAFNRIELPYFKPHTIRDTLTALAYRLKLGPEELKAWSQNLGHKSVLTSYMSYGTLSPERQGEIILSLRNSEGNQQRVWLDSTDAMRKIEQIQALLSTKSL